MRLVSGLSLNLGQIFFQQLFVVQVAIVAVQGEEFVVGARFHDSPVVQYGDAVSIAHRGNSVGDEYGGAALHHFAQVVEDLVFGVSVDAGESIVENESARSWAQKARGIGQ